MRDNGTLLSLSFDNGSLREETGRQVFLMSTAKVSKDGLYTPGDGGWLKVPYDVNLCFPWTGGKDCTIEFFMTLPSTPGTYNCVMSSEENPSPYRGWTINLYGANQMLFSVNGAESNVFPIPGLLNVKYHYALTKKVGQVPSLFVNGVNVGAPGSPNSTDPTQYTQDLSIGAAWVSGWGNLQAYFDEIRISNYIKYTKNFVPPLKPFSSVETIHQGGIYLPSSYRSSMGR